eukprot:UN03557
MKSKATAFVAEYEDLRVLMGVVLNMVRMVFGSLSPRISLSILLS